MAPGVDKKSRIDQPPIVGTAPAVDIEQCKYDTPLMPDMDFYTKCKEAVCSTIPEAQRGETHVIEARGPYYPVSQHEFAVIQKSPEVASILTGGVAPCVVLTLYDPATQTGGLAHFDRTDKIDETIALMAAEFAKRGITNDKIVARIFGGSHALTPCLTTNALKASLKSRGIELIDIKVCRRTFFDGFRTYGINLGDGSDGLVTKMPDSYTKKRVEIPDDVQNTNTPLSNAY